MKTLIQFDTVNLEIFARVSFAKIRGNKTREMTKSLSLTDEGKSCTSREFKCVKYVF